MTGEPKSYPPGEAPQAEARAEAALGQRGATETAHEQHLHRWPALPETLDDLRSARPGQADVDQHEVDGEAVRQRPALGLRAASRIEDGVAISPQHAHHHRAQEVVVLDDQD